MTEPDEALLWAMKQPESLALPVIRMAQGYRAGQAASAERIKALEEQLARYNAARALLKEADQ